MQLKKINSAREEPVGAADIKVEMVSPKAAFSEQAMVVSVFRSRHRIPTAIRSSLRDRHSERQSVKQEEETG